MDLMALSEDELLSIANPILDTIIQGTNQRNYDLFSSHMAESMKTNENKKFIEEQWETNQLPSALCLERKFISTLRKKDCILILWQARSKEVDEDLLHMLYLQNQESNVKVIGTWVR